MEKERIIETILQKRIAIVGSGTAGLIAALMLRKAFPLSPITVISSSAIGIIGVGEGSTEHWRQFMEICDIPVDELLKETKGTHKYGIRFENWTNHTPDYFHSVGSVDEIFAWGYFGTYLKYLGDKKLLTTQTGSIGLIKDKISRELLHKATNQFHFDTNKLNEYFVSLAFKRSVRFIDAKINNVNLNTETGEILSVSTDTGDVVDADFWIDASGFSRVLIGKLDGGNDWQSCLDVLLCNAAIPFPTESDPSGRIKPYTRAIAMSSGWMWEIPTQERRGNGYVFSTDFISEDEAFQEAEQKSGYKIESQRVIKFDPGHLRKPMIKNCYAVGLSAAFVEPLEATSISTTIQQMRIGIPAISAYTKNNKALQKEVNLEFEKLVENIITMIRLHYYSDRMDTSFWRAVSSSHKTETLERMIELWSERPPVRTDFLTSQYQLFSAPHFAHVAQGQGIINHEPCSQIIDSMNIRSIVEMEAEKQRSSRHNRELVDHAEALRELYTIDDEWTSGK